MTAQPYYQSWSIGIICHNEVDNIAAIFAATYAVASALAPEDCFELILVDDGSQDATLKLMQELAQVNRGVRVIAHGNNRGIGKSLWSVYDNACYENVVVVPGDGQFDVEELRPVAVIPPRTVVSFYRLNRPTYTLFRKVVSYCNRGLNRLLFGLNLNDVNWVKVYKRADLKELNVKLRSSLIETEICAKFNRRGYTFMEIQSKYLPRLTGVARGASLKSLGRVAFEFGKLLLIVVDDIWKSGGKAMGKALNVCVVGYGYWGVNIARVFSQSDEFHLHTICDSNPKALAKASRAYPYTNLVANIDAIPKDIDVVAIITPAGQHFPLAKHFLEQGKHVLLTKPFANTIENARELVAIADKKGLTLFIDHTFIFNPAVRKLKELLPKIGQPYFVVTQRMNLGLYQPDVNVIYDLMSHDLSILSYLFDCEVIPVHTFAFSAAGLPQEDVAHASIYTQQGLRGLLTVSWLSPAKIRTFILIGSAGILHYDDNLVAEKVKFCDIGIDVKELTNLDSKAAYTSRIGYRSGDLYAPAIPNYEALGLEVKEFAAAITNAKLRQYYNQVNLHTMVSLDRIVKSAEFAKA